MRFTTNAFPKEQRHDAWRFALQRHSITLGAAGDGLYGELSAVRSELGIDFLVLAATPQQFTVDYSEQRACFWLAMRSRLPMATSPLAGAGSRPASRSKATSIS